MEITVLVDNNTLIDRYFFAEPGLSLLIQDDETTVLFDTGYSDIFLKNAAKMGKDLTTLDYLVLSHSHLDHTWGIESPSSNTTRSWRSKSVFLSVRPWWLIPKSLSVFALTVSGNSAASFPKQSWSNTSRSN